MARKTAKAEPGRNDIIVPSNKVSLTPTSVIQTEARTVNVPMPQEFQGGDEVSTLCPMAVFDENTKPGQYVSGIYLGHKEVNVDGRDSRIYLLDTGGGQTIGVWGSTVLDNQFDFGTNKPKEGQKILIQFLGLGEAKKGFNAPKLFRIVVGR